ncbi:hypothetical protein SDC9_94373 [bioreactor metagenome]|uniref:Uncharacterized protein n=1 Tax=bioreactor metagenome TaxID=1076179 RepID=A0A645A5X3_9ZZZZ
MLPKVVFFSEPDDPFLRDAAFVAPDCVCLVVILVNARPQQVFRNSQHFCEEFPCPRYGVVFKIISEGKITEHFEICAVTRRLSDAVDIRRANALLAGSDAASRRLLRSGEI